MESRSWNYSGVYLVFGGIAYDAYTQSFTRVFPYPSGRLFAVGSEGRKRSPSDDDKKFILECGEWHIVMKIAPRTDYKNNKYW